MRQITLGRGGSYTASGRITHPELIVWKATEGLGINRKVVAVASDKKDLEALFPNAHNDYSHYIDRDGHCHEEGCWRNPATFREEF